MRRKPIPVEKSFANLRKNPAYRVAHAALDEEFTLAGALITAVPEHPLVVDTEEE